MLDVALPKADRLSDWIHRPMSERQLEYAVSDVAHLVELRAVLTKRLEEMGRLEWARDECDEVLADRAASRDPDEAWWRLGDIRSMPKRTRGVAQEVAAWRERTAAASDRPRRTVLSDLGLLAISQRPPHNAEELRRTRGVDGRHLAQGRAAEILDAVRRGLELPAERLRLPSEGREAPASSAALAVCSGLVRQIADDLDFDQALLATRADVAKLLCGEPGRLDSGWRREIVGDALRRLVSGEVAAALTREAPSCSRSAQGAPPDPATRFSNAPMSQAGPWGRGTPRWSVAGQPVAAVPPWSMAGLPARRAMVIVGPPWAPSGPSRGWVDVRSVGRPSAQDVPLSRL